MTGTAEILAEREEVARLLLLDWIVGNTGASIDEALDEGYLHYAELTDADLDRFACDYMFEDGLRFLCGRRVDTAMVPGVFTRMGAERCPKCCDEMGIPRGKGSPKNDPAARRAYGRLGLIEPDSPSKTDLRDRLATDRDLGDELRAESRRRRLGAGEDR